MTEPASQKPLRAHSMFLGSEVLQGLMADRDFRLENERSYRFTKIAAARAGLSAKDPMLKAMLQTAHAKEGEALPDDFQLETFEFEKASEREGIASLVEPLSPEEFFTRQYRRHKPMLFRGPAGRFSHLFSFDDLNVLLRNGNLQPEQLSVLFTNQVVRESDYLQDYRSATGKSNTGRREVRRFDEQGLNFLLRNGGSILINSINSVHDGLGRFIASIASSLGSFASVNLYVSWRDVKAFHTHWDDHDVYILQLEGSKVWNLYGETRKSPLPRDAEPNVDIPKKPKWTGRLESGDVLFIPRGCWHDAIVPEDCTGRGSMHLTLTFKEFNSLDVIDWLQYRIINDWDRARINIPQNAEPGLSREYFQELREAVLAVFDDEPERKFADYYRSRWRESPNVQIGPWIEPWTDPQWSRFQLTVRGAAHACIDMDTEENEFTLTANGRISRFDLRCLDIIEHLLGNGGLSVEELRDFHSERFDAKFMDQFLIQLVKQDVAAAELPESR